jgi:bacterioferritin-associated ferredoxin
MYVCLCNALTERDLQAHTANGGASVAMVYRACGCQPQCGKCVPFIRRMLREQPESATLGQLNGAD